MATEHDEDMYLFNGDVGQTPNAFAGSNFDSFLDSAGAGVEDISTEYVNTDDFPIKKEYHTGLRDDAGYARGSTSSSSTSSSSGSPDHNLDMSTATTTSPTTSKNDVWETGIDGYTMPMHEQYFDGSTMAGTDQDLDQQMASAFDFETAASTPSGFDATAMNSGRVYAPNAPIRRKPNMNGMSNNKPASPRVTAAPASFFLGSREASPLNSMLPTSQAPSPWAKHSPSSGLEETFNHMGMNGDSPGNATFSPNLHMSYSDAQFSFPPGSSGTPSSIAKDFSSPASNISSIAGRPTLTIQPTSLKSRVETQIPIKMALYPLPTGIRKIRLPTHTVSKPKFLAKPDTERSPDTLELSVSLVCTSAMQDPHRKDRALRRARGEDLPAMNRPSPASSSGSASSKDDEEKPLNGGEVKICSGCIQRERKRASRKKQKKPEEEELFQKDEERRVVVFNTNEIKEWQDATQDASLPTDHSPMPTPGTYHVELPMRIACYCRHQNEKMGFMVIFTVKDFRGNVIAQAMTNSIMITDDHKTHNAPQPLPSAPMAPQSHFPGAGVFPTGGDASNETSGPKLFKSSYSTPDLTRMQQGPNNQYSGPGSIPFAIPQAISGNTSATLTPRNLSRPASPSGPSGPATKRRKPSGSGKLPSGLTMTRIDTVQTQPTGPATMPNTAASSPFMPNMPTFMAGADPRNLPSSMHARAFNSPPTPGGDGTFNSVINRSFSLENLPRQATLMSAPSSRQPSRPGSPLADPRNSFGQQDATFPHAVNQSLMGQSSRRPTPVIHKVVPNEGSVSGGTEVTLLGNGFYQGLEVMFGDTEATTTTFWGEKCLNCIAPPGVGPGMVYVVFKHEHPHYAGAQASSHVRQSIYTYVDDREIEMLRLALRTIGKQMGTDDPYAAAQQLLQQNQSVANGMFSQQGAYGSMTNGHSRNASGPGSHDFAPYEMELCLLHMLRLARRQIGSSAIELDLRRPTGLSLLHYAASLGMSHFVSALLAAGADPNILDNNGFTPMHHAALNGHETAINNLRSGGADHRLRSIRNWTPTDLATTLQTWRATMQSYQQSRSQSSSGSTLEASSRNISTRSLNAFWDNTSMPPTESESEYTEEERDTIASPPIGHSLPFAQPLPRSQQNSRRGSRQGLPSPQALARTAQLDAPPASPSTLMNAWRQLVTMTQTQQTQLAEQIQQFHDSMPALPHLPQLDYQNNGVVRRMSSLLPHRFSPPMAAKDGDDSTTPSAPPSYDELYPGSLEGSSMLDKKETTSAIQAAAEAALDQHFQRQETPLKPMLKPNAASLNSQNKARRVGIRDDARLFLFWIPILIVFVSLMAFNSPLPQILSWGKDRLSTLLPLEA